MASVASQMIEEVTAHEQVTVSRMRGIYEQTVLTFRITYVFLGGTLHTPVDHTFSILHVITVSKMLSIFSEIRHYTSTWNSNLRLQTSKQRTSHANSPAVVHETCKKIVGILRICSDT